jgi:hypothetical protein
MTDTTNAERQRRYIKKLKDRADEPHSPDMVLAALAKLQPYHLPKGYEESFAVKLMEEAARLFPAVTNETPATAREALVTKWKPVAQIRE